MGSVITSLSMSLDGFIAFPDDSVGDLFEWYSNGPIEYTEAGEHPFHMTEGNLAFFKEGLDEVGAFLVGRRLYDYTNGWDAKPPAEVPMVVVTHNAPDTWPRDGVPITFATDGIEAAVAEAKELAGDKVVSVCAGALARSVLDAGLMDEIQVSLAPLIIGEGIPWFAGIANGPIRLSDPEVVEGERITHLRYRVER